MDLENVLKTFQREFLVAAIQTGDAGNDKASMDRVVEISSAYTQALAVGLLFAEQEVRSWKLPFHESKVHAILALGIARMVTLMPPGPAPGVRSLQRVFEAALDNAPGARAHVDVDWSNAVQPSPSRVVQEAMVRAMESEEVRLSARTVRRLQQVGRDFGPDHLEELLTRASSGPGSAELAGPVRLVIDAAVSDLAAGQPAEIRTAVGSLILTSYHLGWLLLGRVDGGNPPTDDELGTLAMLATKLEPGDVFEDSTLEPLYVEFLLASVGSEKPLSELPEKVRSWLIKNAAWRGLLLAVGEYDIAVSGDVRADDRAPTNSPSREARTRGLLVDCGACGNTVSVEAVACPKCGHPAAMTREDDPRAGESSVSAVTTLPSGESSALADPELSVPAHASGVGWYAASIVMAVLAVLIGVGVGAVAWAAALIGVLALANGPKPHRRRWMATTALIAGVLFALANAAYYGHLDALLTASGDFDPRSPTATTAPPAGGNAVVDDGVLQVGTFLAASGNAEEIGRTQLAAVRMAVAEINQAGGVLSRPIQLVEVPTSTEPVPASLRGLIDLAEQVDLIVGPTGDQMASDVVGPDALADLRDTPVIVFSPSAGAYGLNRSDPWGYFFRAVPDVVDVGRVMAGQIRLAHRGAYTVALLASDDEFGRSTAIEFERRTRSLGGQLAVSIRFAPEGGDEAMRDAVEEAAMSGSDVMAVISDRITPALAAAFADLGSIPANGIELWVTDAISASVRASDASYAPLFAGMHVIAPLADPAVLDHDFISRLQRHSEVSLTNVFYAAEAYDIVVVAALAAELSGATTQQALSVGIEAVTNGDSTCSTFASCLTLLEAGRSIDYQGLAAPYDFDATGEPTMAQWAVLTFEPNPDAMPSARFVLTDGSPYNRR